VAGGAHEAVIWKSIMWCFLHIYVALHVLFVCSVGAFDSLYRSAVAQLSTYLSL